MRPITDLFPPSSGCSAKRNYETGAVLPVQRKGRVPGSPEKSNVVNVAMPMWLQCLMQKKGGIFGAPEAGMLFSAVGQEKRFMWAYWKLIFYKKYRK